MKKNKNDFRWIIRIIIFAFIISSIFTLISEVMIPNVNILFGIILTILFILIGVVFDMIGVAVTAADISPINSMASKKMKGTKVAIKLKQNAEKVSSFSNDVIGDICGIISGSTGAVIAIKISELNNSLNPLLITVITMAVISTLTIGGKALTKSFAINNSDKILYRVSKIISIFYRR